MPIYFNINFEFNKNKINKIIQQHIEEGVPGYVCSVDGNSLVSANSNPKHLEALNNATVNLCDSAWTPSLINLIHGTKYKNYTGADLFLEYIKEKKYRQFFLGSTPEILQRLKQELIKLDHTISEMRFEPLPFSKVEDFNYKSIAEIINNDNPDIIWISLGAPKQEQFMFHLRPYLRKGMMFGFGAIFNFNSGIKSQRRAPVFFIRLKMEWLYRIFQEPGRLTKRYWNVFLAYPKLIREEIKKPSQN